MTTELKNSAPTPALYSPYPAFLFWFFIIAFNIQYAIYLYFLKLAVSSYWKVRIHRTGNSVLFVAVYQHLEQCLPRLSPPCVCVGWMKEFWSIKEWAIEYLCPYKLINPCIIMIFCYHLTFFLNPHK